MMFSSKSRHNKRIRAAKALKNAARLYKEGNCRECSVVVTRMDFAKILGKFTKVKIQYENSTTPKEKPNVKDSLSPNSNARLTNNENGMVLIHRTAYKEHPVKDLLNSKKQNISNNFNSISPPAKSNILKENNRLKKPTLLKDQNSNYNRKQQSATRYSKQYGILFINPKSENQNDNIKVSLSELIPGIDKNILPSEEWCIDYFPKDEEPKEDHVYDRIAAELEDLMYNDKETSKVIQKDCSQQKPDDFPSIMDILNENTSEVSTNETSNLQSISSESSEFKTNLESTDVEAMLLGNSTKQLPEPMEVDKLIENVALGSDENVTKENSSDTSKKVLGSNEDSALTDERCNSPSILDEALSKGLEEHLPSRTESTEDSKSDQLVDEKSTTVGTSNNSVDEKETNESITSKTDPTMNIDTSKSMETSNDSKTPSTEQSKSNGPTLIKNCQNITHIVFKQMKNGDCYRSITCPKNLKYSIEMEGKPVKLLGAPEYVMSLDDLRVLLQIVSETGLTSFYVLH